jgi:hypothetical protein
LPVALNPSPKCPDCGAPVPAARPTRCEFCGSELSGPTPAPAPGGGPARLRAIRETAAWAQAQRHTPSNPTTAGAVVGVLFALLFCLVPAFMMFLGRRISGAWPFVLVCGLLMLFGVAILIGVLSRALRLLREPIRRLAAVVVDKRTEVSGGGRNSSSSTSYYVTVEDEAGQRVELSAAGELFGVLTTGDTGVAFVLADHLLEFTRITIV